MSFIPNPAPDFDRLARPYRWLEYVSFGPYLWRCRTHFLPELAPCRNALILGDGDGRFTAALLHANPNVKIHAVDASPAMLKSLLSATGTHQNRVTTERADIRHWKPDSSARYDLVVTHFFLDCLTTQEIAVLTTDLAPALSPGAIWLISEFAIPPTRFGRMIGAPLVGFLYRAFRWITNLRLRSLPDHKRALVNAGWSLQLEHRHLQGLIMSQLWRHGTPQR